MVRSLREMLTWCAFSAAAMALLDRVDTLPLLPAALNAFATTVAQRPSSALAASHCRKPLRTPLASRLPQWHVMAKVLYASLTLDSTGCSCSSRCCDPEAKSCRFLGRADEVAPPP